MSIVNQKEYERARDLGAQARRNGQKEGALPYRGFTEKVRLLAEAWRTGYQAEDMARKSRAL